MKVRFLAPARREFLKEVRFYNNEEPGLGAVFTREIEMAAARALAFPDAGSPAAAGTKCVLIKRFPFSLIYRHNEEGVLIIAVAHNSRQPEYWISRA